MNKKLRKFIIILTIAVLAIVAVGWSNNEKDKVKKSNTEVQASNFETVKFVY